MVSCEQLTHHSTLTTHYSTPALIFDPGPFNFFVSWLRSYTLCSNVCAIFIASVGQASTHKLHMVHNSRWYINVSSAFFFLPSGVTSNFVIIFMVPFGQANSHAVQPVHACSLFSSCGITTSPRKRSDNCCFTSGYCCVIISLRCVK